MNSKHLFLVFAIVLLTISDISARRYGGDVIIVGGGGHGGGFGDMFGGLGLALAMSDGDFILGKRR